MVETKRALSISSSPSPIASDHLRSGRDMSRLRSWGERCGNQRVPEFWPQWLSASQQRSLERGSRMEVTGLLQAAQAPLQTVARWQSEVGIYSLSFFFIFVHLCSLNCSVPTAAVHCLGIREASGEAFAPIPEDKMQREIEREIAEAEPSVLPLKPAIKKGKETKVIKEVRTERGKLGKTKPRLKFEGHEEDAMDVPAECDLPFKLWSVVQSRTADELFSSSFTDCLYI